MYTTFTDLCPHTPAVPWVSVKYAHGYFSCSQSFNKVWKKTMASYTSLIFLLCSFIILTLSSVQSLSHVRFFATPWAAARQVSLSITKSWSLLKLMSIELVMPSNHLILLVVGTGGGAGFRMCSRGKVNRSDWQIRSRGWRGVGCGAIDWAGPDWGRKFWGEDIKTPVLL